MAASTSSAQAAGIATRARYVTLAFALMLAVIMYIDRVSLAQAAPFIRRDLALSTKQWGWIASSFAWAYALFEIPGGWLGDRIGPRRVLMRIVVWWSFFTAATGWVLGFGSAMGRRAHAAHRRHLAALRPARRPRCLLVLVGASCWLFIDPGRTIEATART